MLSRKTYQNSLASGEITWAQFAPEPSFTDSKVKVTGAKRQGLNYEKKALDYVEMQIASSENSLRYKFIRSPWLCYKALGTNGKTLYCQPDGVILEQGMGRAVIVEVKLQHTAEAYWQVRKLYQPVLEKIFREFTFSALEIVKWLDPHTPFPEHFKFAESLLHFEPSFGVHIFNPPR